MLKILKISFGATISFYLFISIALANPWVNAVAVTATSSAIATTSAVYMRENNIPAQIVNTNVGPIAIPASSNTNNANIEENYYQQQQESIQQKRDFMNN